MDTILNQEDVNKFPNIAMAIIYKQGNALLVNLGLLYSKANATI